MKRSVRHMLMFPAPDPAQTADMSQLAEEIKEPSAMAPAVDPSEHGVTGPEGDDPGKAKGMVGGQEEREKAAETPTTNDEPKTSEEPAAEEYEEFEITIAEDSLLSQEQFDGLMDVVEKSGMNEAEARAFIEKQEGLVTIGSKLVHDARAAQAEENRKALVNDPMFGGTEESFQKALKVMTKPVQAFGDEGFNELLTSEIGNHPALGRFLFQLGKAMESEGFHGKGGSPPAAKKSPQQILYPSLFEKA